MRENPRKASRRRSGRERPDARRERDEASDPEHRGDEVEPVGEAGEEGRVRLHALVPREREPGRKPDPDQKGRPQEPRTVEDPGEEHQCRHERVPERHRDERDAETSLRRDRREVAVEEVDERDLQGVGGTHHERGDADVEHGDATDGRDPVEPVRKPRRQRLAEHEQPETDRPDDERERDEERPAGGVVRPVRPRRAVGLGRRRRRHADTERVDAGARVAVRRRRPPADRVCLPPLQPGERRADDPSVGGADRGTRDLAPGGGVDLDRAGGDRDRLVEAEDDGPGRSVEPGLRRRSRRGQGRMRLRGAGKCEREGCDAEKEPSHWPPA